MLVPTSTDTAGTVECGTSRGSAHAHGRCTTGAAACGLLEQRRKEGQWKSREASMMPNALRVDEPAPSITNRRKASSLRSINGLGIRPTRTPLLTSESLSGFPPVRWRLRKPDHSSDRDWPQARAVIHNVRRRHLAARVPNTFQ